MSTDTHRPSDFSNKSSVAEIRERFDHDVERFSDLDVVQVAAIDAPVHLELVTQAAASHKPRATSLLDVGCGAGNYAIQLLRALNASRPEPPTIDVTLLDLSQPMLDRAGQRIAAETRGKVDTQQTDIRDADLGRERFDIVLAGQCLHHLRGDEEWRATFIKLHDALGPGGGLWIADSIDHTTAQTRALVRRRWREYLTDVKDAAYAEHVMAYVDKEDTPRPLVWQLDLLREVGFAAVDVLHVNNRFASFGAMKRIA